MVKSLRVSASLSSFIALVIGLGLHQTALANPQFIPVDFSSVDTSSCGFPVAVHLQGTLVAQSNGENTTGANYRTTFTNLDNGKTVVLRLSGLQVLTVEASADEVVLTFLFSGGSRLVVSGGGTAIDVGRVVETVVLDAATGEVISDTVTGVGRSDVITMDLICQALAN